jgi:hypothetical protein
MTFFSLCFEGKATSDDRSKVDRHAPHKPNACLGSSRTLLMADRDQPFLIFTPDVVLFDCPPNSAGFVRSFDQVDKRSPRRLVPDH